MNALTIGVLSAATGLTGAVVGDLLGEEIRNRLDRIPVLLVRLACRRFPAPERRDREDEWVAELAAILDRRGATKLPVTRLAVGIRYALGLSLAVPAMRESKPGTAAAVQVLLPALAVVGESVLFSTVLAQYVQTAIEVLILAISVRLIVAAIKQRSAALATAAAATIPLIAFGDFDLIPSMGFAHLAGVIGALQLWQPALLVAAARFVVRIPRAIPLFLATVSGAASVAVVTQDFWSVDVGNFVSVESGILLGTGLVLLYVSAFTKSRTEHRGRVLFVGITSMLAGTMVLNLDSGPSGISLLLAFGTACGLFMAFTPPRWTMLPWAKNRQRPAVGSANTA